MSGLTYAQYLARRGLSGQASTREVLLGPWSAPGFHLFWRRWNPHLGYLLFRTYVALGGGRHHALSSLVVFLLAGAAHDLVVPLLTGFPSIGVTVAFGFYWAASNGCRIAGSFARFRRWPKSACVSLNLALVGAGLALGGVAQHAFLARIAA